MEVLSSFIYMGNGETTSSASGFTEGDHWVLVTDSCGDTTMYEFNVVDYILETSVYHTNNPENYAKLRSLIQQLDLHLTINGMMRI